jgi:hypothetical protein
MWGGLLAGSRPLGGSFFDTTSLLEAGCRLNSPPHIALFSRRLVSVGSSL